MSATGCRPCWLRAWGRVSATRAEDLHLQSDAREERQDDAGGDELDRALNGCAAHKADGIEECGQIPDIEGGFLAIEPDIGERTFGTFLAVMSVTPSGRQRSAQRQTP
jgi:hypothetical protein